jgi:hypothetical protein
MTYIFVEVHYFKPNLKTKHWLFARVRITVQGRAGLIWQAVPGF